MASNLPPGLEHSDPHFHEDVDRDCTCGHPRDCHDLADGHEICLWGWPDPNHLPIGTGDAIVEPCPCTNYEPEEHDG